MKRLLAVLLLCCCLLWCIPAALAEPAALPEEEVTEPAEGEDAAAEEQEAPAGEETEETQQTGETEEAEEDMPPAPDFTALGSETSIHTMEIMAIIDESGRATVNQKIEMVVVGEAEELRFSFPAGAKKTDVDGYRTSMERKDGIKYLTVSSRKGFTGTQTFNLSYTIGDLVKGSEASQVLTLPLLSLQDYQIGKLTFTVVLPEEFAGRPRFSSGYYNNLVEDLIPINVKPTSIAGYVNEIMRDNDSLTMTLSLPEGYFAGSYVRNDMSPGLTVAVVILLLLAVVYWFRTLRNPPLRAHARTLPPDGVNPGDIPFLLAGGNADFNMLVSHWAVLGYLSFYVTRSGNVILQRRMPMGNERRTFERKLFDLLFGGDTICDGASVRYKRVGEKAMEVIPRYWHKRLYEKRSGSPALVKLLCSLACALSAVMAMDAVAPDKLHGMFLLVAFVAGFAMCWVIYQACSAYYLNDWLWVALGIGCALLLLVVGGLGGATATVLPSVLVTGLLAWQCVHGGMRKPYGDQVIGQTIGFRRYLHNATESHMMQMQRRDPQYFYRILPYAEAMGQGKRFVTLFQNCKLEPCHWYESARSVPTTAAGFYDHYVDALDMLNLSIRK